MTRAQAPVVSTGYWLVTLAAFAATIGLLAFYTPTEATMGPVQKIFYFHLPVAISTFVACLIVCVAGVGYLWQRRMWWDDLGAAAAKVAALYCGIVLLTGMVWGKSAWGQWWTWSPRLTFSLVLFLLYVVYLMLRPSIESPQRRALVSAVYGIAAFADVPIVYLSVKLIPDIHPSSISLAPPMKLTLMLWFVPVVLMLIGLIRAQHGVHRRLRERRMEADEPAGNIAEAGGVA